MAINKRFTHLNHSGSNHSILDAESAYITGTLQVGPAIPVLGSDVNFFVSGNIGGTGSLTPGVGVFGGDLVVSGNLIVEGTYPSGGGGENYFWSPANAEIEASGSLHISQSFRALSLSASNGLEVSGSAVFAGAGGVTVGSDAVLFVSGNTGSDSGYKSVFGGTVFVSGNMQVPFQGKIQSRGTGSAWVDIAQYADATGLGFGPQTLVVGDTENNQFNNTGIVFVGDGRPLAVITGSNQGFFSGSYKFHDGLSGSLQSLPDGSPYLISGPNITITTNSLGQIEITGSAGATSPEYFYSITNDLVETSGSLFVSGNLRALSLSASNGAEVTGSAVFVLNQGLTNGVIISGSYNNSVPAIDVYDADAGGTVFKVDLGNYLARIQEPADPTNQYTEIKPSKVEVTYINAGSEKENSVLIDANGASGPEIRFYVSSSVGVGPPTPAEAEIYVYDENATLQNLTIKSNILKFDGAGGATVGSDTQFFVSGAVSGKDILGQGVAVFGGDLVVSGVMYADNKLQVRDGGQLIAAIDNNIGQASFYVSITGSNGMLLTGALNASPDGTGRGLLKFGGLDIGPITGSVTLATPNPGDGIVNGNILSASAGVWNGSTAAVLRHEFHILGIGVDSGSGVQTFAATYLVMSAVDTGGVQTALSVTEVSRETSGSFAAAWDVNVAANCDIEVTASIDAGDVQWYAQRVKEMSLNTSGSRT
jgi:hypothetical protein